MKVTFDDGTTGWVDDLTYECYFAKPAPADEHPSYAVRETPYSQVPRKPAASQPAKKKILPDIAHGQFSHDERMRHLDKLIRKGKGDTPEAGFEIDWQGIKSA